MLYKNITKSCEITAYYESTNESIGVTMLWPVLPVVQIRRSSSNASQLTAEENKSTPTGLHRIEIVVLINQSISISKQVTLYYFYSVHWQDVTYLSLHVDALRVH